MNKLGNWLICGLTSNQFIFVPKCIKVVNLVKFPRVIYIVLTNFSIRSSMYAGTPLSLTDSLKTDCLLWLTATKGHKNKTSEHLL